MTGGNNTEPVSVPTVCPVCGAEAQLTLTATHSEQRCACGYERRSALADLAMGAGPVDPSKGGGWIGKVGPVASDE